MDTLSPSMRNLARKLLAAGQSDSNSHLHDAVLVCDRLRVSLTRFAGAEGFASLQSRALALACAEVPALRNVKIGADGRLEGLEGLGADHQPGVSEPAVAITGHLLELLVTFIGEPLTLKLVQQAWPDMPLETASRIEDDR